MLIMQTIRLRAMIIVKQEQLLSAIEAIDGSTYFDGLEYEYFLKLKQSIYKMNWIYKYSRLCEMKS